MPDDDARYDHSGPFDRVGSSFRRMQGELVKQSRVISNKANKGSTGASPRFAARDDCNVRFLFHFAISLSAENSAKPARLADPELSPAPYHGGGTRGANSGEVLLACCRCDATPALGRSATLRVL